MHRATRLVALAAVSAILAACSATGSNQLPSSTFNSASSSSVSIPRAVQDRSGNVRVMFYNVQAERSGLVGGYADKSGRTALRHVTSSNLTYHSGPIQTAPKIYVVEWGNWTTGDPSGEYTYYKSFISAVGGSQWLNSVVQYTQSDGSHVGNAAGSYAGTWPDTTNAIPNLNTNTYQSSIAAEAARAAAHFGDYSASASYVILIPHGVPVYQFAGNYGGLNGYCAWHSSTSASGGRIAYTNFPYQSDAGASCGEASVTSPGTNDGASIVGGHEQAETETDPQPNTGWLDSSGAENGDKCAWKNLQNTSFGNAGSFPTQPLWSNAVTGCVQ